MIKKALTALGCISLAVNAIEIKSGIKIDTEADADEYEMWPGLQITWVDESTGDFQEVFSGLCKQVVFETSPGIKLRLDDCDNLIFYTDLNPQCLFVPFEYSQTDCASYAAMVPITCGVDPPQGPPTSGDECTNTLYSEKGCDWYDSNTQEMTFGNVQVFDETTFGQIKSVRLRGQTAMYAYDGVRLAGRKVVQANLWPRVTEPEARRNCICFDVDDALAQPFSIKSYELRDLTSTDEL